MQGFFARNLGCRQSRSCWWWTKGNSRRIGRKVKKGLSEDDGLRLAKSVALKLEEGNYKGAVRLLCSDDTPAQTSVEVLRALQDKHLSAHLERDMPPAPIHSQLTKDLTTDVIWRAVKSF